MSYYNPNYNGVSTYTPVYVPNNAYGNNVPNYNQTYASPEQDTTVSWVQGKSGAEAYPMAPGRRAMLMDSNEPILYVKQTDASGRYMPLQSYRLVPIEEPLSNTASIPQETIDYEKIRTMISEELRQYMDPNQAKKKDGGK